MALTWYDILDILPGASAGEVRSACAAKAGVLAPELISGAPSKVVTAAGRARACLRHGPAGRRADRAGVASGRGRAALRASRSGRSAAPGA